LVLSSTGDFRVENPAWNGLTEFSSQNNATVLTSLDNLPPFAKDTAVIIIPYSEYTQSELEKTKDYVESGGTLLVMDDFGSGNQILDSLGVNMHFVGQPLLDPLFDYQTKQLPIITDFTNTTQNANVSTIVFNHPTSLSISEITPSLHILRVLASSTQTTMENGTTGNSRSPTSSGIHTSRRGLRCGIVRPQCTN
jgi:hypothetical protein